MADSQTYNSAWTIPSPTPWKPGDPTRSGAAPYMPNQGTGYDEWYGKTYGAGSDPVAATQQPKMELPETPATTPATKPAAATKPSGGNLRDPDYATQFVNYWSAQPGVNPSLARDPNYWVQKITSGELGADENYIVSKFMTPEGAPMGSGGGGGGQSQWKADPRTDELYNYLKQRATQSLDVNSKDPIIANQVNAYGAQQTRASRDYLAGLAEKGGPDANLGSERRMVSETAGQNTGAFEAQLMQQELTARRKEIQDALTQGGQLLSDQQRLELQNQLALMDNALAYAGLNQQNTQFGQTLGQNAYIFDVNDEYRRSPLAGGG